MGPDRNTHLRNAAIVLGNAGDERALPALRRALNDDEVIAEAAAWAMERLQLRTSEAMQAC